MIYFCFKSLVRTTTIIIIISVIRPPIYVDILHQRDQIFVHLPNYCLDVNTLIHFFAVCIRLAPLMMELTKAEKNKKLLCAIFLLLYFYVF